MSLSSVGSIFDLSFQQINLFNQTLLPQEKNPHSLWGCSSLSGFLSKDEGLLECGYSDVMILEKKKVTFEAIAKKLEYIAKLAMNKESDELIQSKFKVNFNNYPLGKQYCPFSKISDITPSSQSNFEGACGESNFDFVIHNVNLNRSIMVSGLLTHLIRKHHFFEGHVQYRLDPLEVIEVLEIGPVSNFTSAFSLPYPQMSRNLHFLESSMKWKIVETCSFKSKAYPKNLATHYNKQLYNFGIGVVGLILPHINENEDVTNNLIELNCNYLHLFNLGSTEKLVSCRINQIEITNIKILPKQQLILKSA